MNIVISAAATSAGKTLVAQALCSALDRAGKRVHHTKSDRTASKRASTNALQAETAYNVDLWLDGGEGVRAHVAATRGDADVALFENMMGLYDGDDDGASTSADVAKSFDAQVVIVLDLWAASQTGAAVAPGLRDYDPEVRIAGVILNRVGGVKHQRGARDACASRNIAVLGSIPHAAAYAAADRRLGLDPEGIERPFAAVKEFGERIFREWDLAPFTGFPESMNVAEAASDNVASSPMTHRARIAHAHDRAFWFTYAETLALRLAGAEMVPFSPSSTMLYPRTPTVLGSAEATPKASLVNSMPTYRCANQSPKPTRRTFRRMPNAAA